MILYHFTSRWHLQHIVLDGFIKTTESNVSPHHAHAGSDVVWLTSDPNPATHSGWKEGSAVDKTEVRFTLELPDTEVRQWQWWSENYDIDLRWAAALESVGGHESWYVIERPVTRFEWTKIEKLKRGVK